MSSSSPSVRPQDSCAKLLYFGSGCAVPEVQLPAGSRSVCRHRGGAPSLPAAPSFTDTSPACLFMGKRRASPKRPPGNSFVLYFGGGPERPLRPCPTFPPSSESTTAPWSDERRWRYEAIQTLEECFGISVISEYHQEKT